MKKLFWLLPTRYPVKRSTILAPYIVLGLFVGAPVIWWMLPTAEGIKAKRVTRAVRSLPIGITRNQVAALLHKEDMGAQTGYITGEELSTPSSDMEDNGYTAKDLSGYYVASIAHTSKSLIGECDTYYFFFFNKKERLIKVTVQEQCIGL